MADTSTSVYSLGVGEMLEKRRISYMGFIQEKSMGRRRGGIE